MVSFLFFRSVPRLTRKHVLCENLSSDDPRYIIFLYVDLALADNPKICLLYSDSIFRRDCFIWPDKKTEAKTSLPLIRRSDSVLGTVSACS